MSLAILDKASGNHPRRVHTTLRGNRFSLLYPVGHETAPLLATCQHINLLLGLGQTLELMYLGGEA